MIAKAQLLNEADMQTSGRVVGQSQDHLTARCALIMEIQAVRQALGHENALGLCSLQQCRPYGGGEGW